MRAFILGTVQGDGSQMILRKSARGNFTAFGEVLVSPNNDNREYWWRFYGGDLSGPCDSAGEALAGFVADYKARRTKLK